MILTGRSEVSRGVLSAARAARSQLRLPSSRAVENPATPNSLNDGELDFAVLRDLQRFGTTGNRSRGPRHLSRHESIFRSPAGVAWCVRRSHNRPKRLPTGAQKLQCLRGPQLRIGRLRHAEIVKPSLKCAFQMWTEAVTQLMPRQRKRNARAMLDMSRPRGQIVLGFATAIMPRRG